MVKWSRFLLRKKKPKTIIEDGIKDGEKEENECPICFKVEVGFSILVPCKHEICVECLSEYRLRNINKCPLCRSYFKNSSPKKNNIKYENINMSEILFCKSRSEHVYASIKMAKCLPRRLNICVYNIVSNNSFYVQVKDLLRTLYNCNELRIKNEIRFAYFFD